MTTDYMAAAAVRSRNGMKYLIVPLVFLWCIGFCSGGEHVRFFRRSAGMVSIDTQSDRMYSYNSAPFGHDSIELFFSKDAGGTFWGALRGGCNGKVIS